jgi:methyl-accepting chemotaxis protein
MGRDREDRERGPEASTAPERERSDRRPFVSVLVPDVVRRRYTLKFGAVVILMALVVLVIGTTATTVVASEVEGNVEKEQRDLARQKANVVEKWVQRNSISVKLGSKNDALARTGGRSRYDIRGELATTGANLYGVNAILLVEGSQERMDVVASPQLPFDIDVADTSRDWLLDVPVSRMGVADVHISEVYRTDGRPAIAFVSPVQGTENRYLVLEYELGPLARSLQQSESVTGFTQVVSRSGTVQVAARPDEVLGTYGGAEAMDHVEHASRIGERPGVSAGVVVSAGPDEAVMDRKYTVGYAPVQVGNTDLNWVVLAHEPTTNVFWFSQAVSLWGKAATLAGVASILLLGGAIGYSTTRDIRELRRHTDEMRRGDLDVDISSHRIDSIGKLYDGFDQMRVELRRQIAEANEAREAAERSRAEAVRMNEYLQEKAEAYSVTMERCARGDLTRRLEPDGENEAMDRIALDFNEMMHELERTTSQLDQFAEAVQVTGEELESSAESVMVSSEHVAESVQTVSDDALDQKDRLESLSTEIDGLVAQFEAAAAEHDDLDVEEPLTRLSEIAETVSEVAEISEQTFAETEIVAGASQTQAAELGDVSRRSADLVAHARPLREVLGEFETDVDDELDVDREAARGPTGDGVASTDGGESRAE